MSNCRVCSVVLEVGKNWLHSSKATNQYTCKSCKAEYLYEWRQRNPGSYKQWKYGITQAQYEEMIYNQDNKCAICGTTKPGGRHNSWHIDHDHKTNKVRGLLCWLCNSGLGKFQDDKELLKTAITYLEKYDES